MKILGNNLPGKLLTLAAATSLLAACSNEPTATHEAAPAKKAEAGETVASKAIAMLEPTQGNNVKGKVVLTMVIRCCCCCSVAAKADRRLSQPGGANPMRKVLAISPLSPRSFK